MSVLGGIIGYTVTKIPTSRDSVVSSSIVLWGLCGLVGVVIAIAVAFWVTNYED